MFNVTGQLNKQLCAVAVIFAQAYFATMSLLYSNGHLCFSIIALSYSLICLFSFLNLTYVRDFDALQVNFVPVVLSVAGIVAFNLGSSVSMAGLVLSLVADSYFALRFKTHTDAITYTPIELFGMESWTQQAFTRKNNLGLQLLASASIFGQLYLAIVGSTLGVQFSMVLIAFFLTRLVQFIGHTVLGLQMAQSNMACVSLAAISIFTQLGQGFVPTLSCIALIGDSVIGTAIFYFLNQQSVNRQINLVRKLSTFSHSDRIKIEFVGIDNQFEKV